MTDLSIDPALFPTALAALDVATKLAGSFDHYAREALEEAILLLAESAGLGEKERAVIGALLDAKWSGGKSEYELAKVREQVVEVSGAAE